MCSDSDNDKDFHSESWCFLLVFLTGAILGSLTHLALTASIKPPAAGRATEVGLLHRSGQADGQGSCIRKVLRVYSAVPVGPPDLPLCSDNGSLPGRPGS